MSLPIEETPTLYGKDAEIFLEKLNQHKPYISNISPKQVLENIKKIKLQQIIPR